MIDTESVAGTCWAMVLSKVLVGLLVRLQLVEPQLIIIDKTQSLRKRSFVKSFGSQADLGRYLLSVQVIY